jgi:FkbM family methyltransferase
MVTLHVTPKHIVVLAAFVLSLASLSQLSRTSTSPSLRLYRSTMTTTSKANTISQLSIRTVGEIKQSMILPCNYVHDGFFVPHSSEFANQVYQTLMELPDDVVPLMIEVGGHDGITKSMSLKVSRCLGVNTMLIEASPSNYDVLEKSRPYDHTVNAALCEGDYAEMEESERNSGQSKLQRPSSGKTSSESKTVRVPCTSIDNEMDKFKDKLPSHLKNKLALVFLVLDVEGFEPIAIKGINRYSPMKAYIEWTRVKEDDNKSMLKWAAKHNLHGGMCGPLKRDMCFNFHPTLFFDESGDETPQPPPKPWMKDVFYGARLAVPEDTAVTSRASKSYIFYGE